MTNVELQMLHINTVTGSPGNHLEGCDRSIICPSVLAHESEEIFQMMCSEARIRPIARRIKDSVNQSQTVIQNTRPDRVFGERHNDSSAPIELLSHSFRTKKKRQVKIMEQKIKAQNSLFKTLLS
jgi:hypothetical protein